MGTRGHESSAHNNPINAIIIPQADMAQSGERIWEAHPSRNFGTGLLAVQYHFYNII